MLITKTKDGKMVSWYRNTKVLEAEQVDEGYQITYLYHPVDRFLSSFDELIQDPYDIIRLQRLDAYRKSGFFVEFNREQPLKYHIKSHGVTCTAVEEHAGYNIFVGNSRVSYFEGKCLILQGKVWNLEELADKDTYATFNRLCTPITSNKDTPFVNIGEQYNLLFLYDAMSLTVKQAAVDILRITAHWGSAVNPKPLKTVKVLDQSESLRDLNTKLEAMSHNRFLWDYYKGQMQLADEEDLTPEWWTAEASAEFIKRF